MTSVVPPPPTALQSTGMPQAPLVSQTPVRRADAPSRGRGLRAAALAALCLAELLVVIDNTIVNVAIPTFARDLNASTTGLQWIVDAYTLAFACLLLPAGHLGDRIGRRRVLVIGLAAFGVVSGATALCTTLDAVTTCRALLGVCAALVYPATLSLIMTTFEGSSRRGLAVGLWAATSGLGIALGPILGGLLLEHFSWESIFWVNVPLALITVPAVLVAVPESRSSEKARFDVVGAILSAIGVGALVWGIIEGPHRGWTSGSVTTAFIVGAICVSALVAWELYWPHPLIDVRLFFRREFSAGAVSIAAAFFALFGFIFIITQYFQDVRGYSALMAGVATLPFAIVMAVVSPIASVLSRRLGPGWVVGVGLGIMGLGFWRVTVLEADSAYWQMIVPAMVIMAAGLALVQAPATSAIMGVVRKDQVGAASAMNDTTREIGGTLGVAVLGSIVASQFSDSLNSAVSGLMPQQALDQADNSITAAMTVAKYMPETVQGLFKEAAVNAFMDTVHQAGWVVACVAWAGALIAVIALPRGRQNSV